MRIRIPGAIAIALAAACSSGDMTTDGTTTPTTPTTGGVAALACLESGVNTNPFKVANAMAANTADHELATDYTYSAAAAIPITLDGTSATIGGTGATASGSVVTISAAGTYRVSGSLTNGQVLVNTSDTGIVRLVLDGVTISTTSGPGIAFTKAKKGVIVLAAGSTNSVTDGTTYPSGSDPDAAVYSKGNLAIGGTGALTVNARFNDGITSKDGLVIASGTFNVTSVDDGIRGKDYLVVRGGTFTVNAGGDGLKSDEDGDAALGYIRIEGGTFGITAKGDAVQAETDALIQGGTITAKTAGGSSVRIADSLSAKAIKAGVYVIVDDGVLTLDAADDGLHSNARLVVNGGTITIASGDDGIHADSALTINAGRIDITKSYEGIENTLADMTFNGGTIHIVSSDDGINLAGAGDSMGPGTSSAPYTMRINGGRLVVNATGDGLDANGSIIMTGGCAIIHGPTANNNAPIDYNNTFQITGGYLIAAGSSGMAQQPGSTSTQPTLMLVFSSAKAAGSIIHIQSSAGDDLLDFAPLRSAQSLVFSAPTLTRGSSYQIYYGGSSTGTATDGVYQNGNYTAGTLGGSVTLSNVATRSSM